MQVYQITVILGPTIRVQLRNPDGSVWDIVPMEPIPSPLEEGWGFSLQLEGEALTMEYMVRESEEILELLRLKEIPLF